jgi:hypothetical protein
MHLDAGRVPATENGRRVTPNLASTLPPKLPLDPDVDLELLSYEDLAGAKSRT